ncbi:MAG: hypothetical protein DCC65_12015 [Planctomycetota bacterium]|nr:MAG: hypothetical protein DCC65_12015 [Planctomycetota bacterium]
MSRAATLDETSLRSILTWAAERQAPVTASLISEGRWCNLRSHVIRYDGQAHVLQIVYPISTDTMAPPEITAGEELGLSLRRGHKKCVFVCQVLMRRLDKGGDGQALDTLVVRAPRQMRELQRRVYQRVIIPEERFIATRLWQGGLPSPGEPCWPICSGRVANMSLGGMLMDIRADQNPRLGVGDVVGVEITHMPGREPLMAEAQYRHCVMTGADRIGIGLQFVGLEHERPGRTGISELAEFVRSLRAGGARIDREE